MVNSWGRVAQQTNQGFIIDMKWEYHFFRGRVNKVNILMYSL